MKTLNLFLYGEDSLSDVRQIRNDALAALNSGNIIEWNSDSVSVKKIMNYPVEQIINEANIFLRLYDSNIRSVNPIITETKPNLFFT